MLWKNLIFRQVGELALRSEGRESYPILPPAARLGWAGPAPYVGSTTGATPLVSIEELSPLLTHHVVARVGERGLLPTPINTWGRWEIQPWEHEGRRAAPAPCSWWQGVNTPGQCRRPHPGGEDKGEWKSIQKSEESTFSLYCEVLKDEIQGVNIGNKSLYMFLLFKTIDPDPTVSLSWSKLKQKSSFFFFSWMKLGQEGRRKERRQNDYPRVSFTTNLCFVSLCFELHLLGHNGKCIF